MQPLAQLILCLVNLVFLVNGGFIIYFGWTFKNNQWSELYSATNVSTSTISSCVMLFGAFVLFISLLGFFGAAFKCRCLLISYTTFLVIALIFFVVLTILGFVVGNGAKLWESKSYPAIDEEISVARLFNKMYCNTQGARICTSLPAKDGLSIFPSHIALNVSSLASHADIRLFESIGMLSFCNKVMMKGSSVVSHFPPEFIALCRACNSIGQTTHAEEKWRMLFNWATDHCNLSNSNGYCFDEMYQFNSTSDSLPYHKCRPILLGLWQRYGNYVGIGSLFLLAVSLVLIFMANYVPRSPKKTSAA